MSQDMKMIAADLSKLLEDVKEKPVIVKTTAKLEAASQGVTPEENSVAIDIVKIVIANAPVGTDPSSIGEAFLIAAQTKAEETNTSTRQVVESVFDYLIEAI